MTRCWVVAGPNGSGKTTFVDKYVMEPADWALARFEADAVSRDLRDENHALSQGEADLRAAAIVAESVDAAIRDGEPFVLETVLSTNKYFSRALDVRRAGLELAFMFVFLRSPEDSILRIKDRVERKKLHDVAPDKVRSRWPRSLRRARYMFALADRAVVVDNTPEPALSVVAKTPARGRFPTQPRSWIAGQSDDIREMIDACLTPPDWLENAIADCQKASFAKEPCEDLLQAIEAEDPDPVRA